MNESKDKIVRWEWHGSIILLIVLCFTVILIPAAVVYFVTQLIRLETAVDDAEAFSEFLSKQRATKGA